MNKRRVVDKLNKCRDASLMNERRRKQSALRRGVSVTAITIMCGRDGWMDGAGMPGQAQTGERRRT